MCPKSETGAVFFLSGVCCAAQETQVQRILEGTLGPGSYMFNPITSELTLRDTRDARAVTRQLRRAGFAVTSKDDLQRAPTFWRAHVQALSTVLAGVLAAAGILMERPDTPSGMSRALLLAAIIVGGWRIFVKAIKAARSFSLDMNFLMAVAVFGAVLIGKWGEGAAVVVLFALSLALESYSASRTRKAIRSLMTLAPDEAHVIREGREAVVPAHSVVPGEEIVIRPGERVPLDGQVIDGGSSVNQAAITGEAEPVWKSAGGSVYAGSMNGRGSMRLKVTRRFEDTTLARIVHLVEESQQKRAPVQVYVDRFARFYSPAVLVVAVVIAVIPPFVFQLTFEESLYRALVLLVIACPCALVISTPLTIVSAVTRAARLGILIKGGTHIETMAAVKSIAFDKTGTLTEGKPRVTDVIPLNSLSPESVLQLAAAIERQSEHHIASAVLAEADSRRIRHVDISTEGFEAIPGKGVRAVIGGAVYYLGNLGFCKERNYYSPAVERIAGTLLREGKTAVVLGKEREALGVLAIRDSPRGEAAPVIERLQRLGIDNIVMLSGDHEPAVKRVADEVGLTACAAGLLPEHKVKLVEDLKACHGTVAMVGDGINDAPGLAASSVGIAMGTNGTDAALETADVVLMSDDLARLPVLVGLCRKAMSIIKQNVAIALLLKLILLGLSISGLTTLWLAVLADDGATLVVILNGLRLLGYSDD
jgi:Cd2+/Zn2+-exporting ATPase